jgi:hypothetical protein
MIISVDEANAATKTSFPSSTFFRVGPDEGVETTGLWAWIKEKVRSFINWMFGWWSPEASLPLGEHTRTPATGSGSGAQSGSKTTPTPTPSPTATPTVTPTTGVDVELKAQVSSLAMLGEVVESRFTLQNRGKEKATGVKLDLTVPKELRITDAVPRERCTISGQNASCTFPELSSGQIVPVLIAMRTSVEGTFRVSANVKAKEKETNLGNNLSEAEVSVKKENKDGGDKKEKETVSTRPSVSPTASPKSQPSPSPHPTKAPSSPPEKLPTTGPIPLGIALIAIGVGWFALQKRMGR